MHTMDLPTPPPHTDKHVRQAVRVKHAPAVGFMAAMYCVSTISLRTPCVVGVGSRGDSCVSGGVGWERRPGTHGPIPHPTTPYQVPPVEPAPVAQLLREQGNGVLRAIVFDIGQVQVVEEEEGAVALCVCVCSIGAVVRSACGGW